MIHTLGLMRKVPVFVVLRVHRGVGVVSRGVEGQGGL